MKKNIIIEGKKINTLKDFHNQIMVKMEFPDYYGKNLDALWDSLTGYADIDIKLIWEDHNYSRLKIGDKDFNRIKELLYEVKGEHPYFEIFFN